MTPYLPAQEKRIVWRRRRLQARQRLLPRNPRRRVLRGPRADDAGRVLRERGDRAARDRQDGRRSASEALAQTPLGSEVIGVPAKAGKRPGYVVKQEPRNGFLSANEHGAALRHPTRSPLRPAAEPRRLERRRRPIASRALEARTSITYDTGPAGAVLEQKPEPGVAAGRGLKVRSSSGRATPSPTLDDVAPGQLGRLRDADPRRRDDVDGASGRDERERGRSDRQAVVARRRSRVPG